MITITRRFEFDAGHRVLGHEGKCRHLHGHRYVADVTVRAPVELDSLQRVIDFGRIKTIIGAWIDENWDHNMLLNSKDPLLAIAYPLIGDTKGDTVFGQGKRPYLFPNRNPTAEMMAVDLYKQVKELLVRHNTGVLVDHVRIYETPNCWADYPCSKSPTGD